MCCAAFYIPYTRSQLRKEVDPKDPDKRLRDAAQIAEMVIPLTPKEANERQVQFGGEDGKFRWADRGHHFTCRHWDEETRLCGIYEDRPEMCRGFPYGKGCGYGCECVGYPLGEDKPDDV